MNVGLGILVEAVAFVAAAYVVVELRRRLAPRTTGIVLAGVGAVMGAGALLFQRDVSTVGSVLAPLFGGFLLAAHVRVLDAVGVTLPAWVKIPTLGRSRAYASAPAMSRTIEEPVQQPQSTAEPEPDSGFDPELEVGTELEPGLDAESELAPPLEPIAPEHAWPSTLVRRRATTTRLPRRGARRTRVEVRRISPFSVLKFSLIFYFCIFLVMYLALAIIWAILSASGAIDSVERFLGLLFPSTSPTGEISTRGSQPLEIDTGTVFTWLFFAGCVGVAIWSLINVFVSVMYNLISDIVGGVEVTLADRRD
jgi:hypothetical protein